ncbi:MAG: hypothetical protein P1R58_06285 [bacterium]|nr:hypothetical protein [bacterium]
MKKLTTKVIAGIATVVVIAAPNVGALSTACERFASSAGPGTYDSVYWALKCIATSVTDFLDIAGF